ncbi:unnamed protein product [Leuciscus chuanchicus]
MEFGDRCGNQRAAIDFPLPELMSSPTACTVCLFTPSELSTVAGLLQPTTILTFNSGNTNVTSAALHPKVRLNGEAFDQLSDSETREGYQHGVRVAHQPTNQQECLGTDEGTVTEKRDLRWV